MASLASPVKWLLDFFTGISEGETSQVSGDKALTYAPFWNCVNKISGNIGVMPLCLYNRTQDGKELASDDDRYRLLMRRPNAYQTPIIFKQLITTHSLMWGNGRAYIARSGRRVSELIPLLPDRTKTLMVMGKKYHITWPHDADRLLEFEETGVVGPYHDVVLMEDSEVIHIPGFGLDGVEGISLLKAAARCISGGIEGDKRYNTQVSKGFSSKGMLEVPKNMFKDESEAKKFMDQFNEAHSGASKADKVGMLREGIKYQAIAMSNQDAEFLKSRQFNKQDTALWFLVENILGDGQTEVYKSLSERQSSYLKNCLLTWMTKWEEELNLKLLNPREQSADSMFFKFDNSVFLTTDFASSVKTYREAVESMILTRNEARDALDYNTVDGGDVFENPNTTSGNSPENPDSSQPQNLERTAVKTQIAHLIGVEKNRVLQCCDKPEKFLAQVDKFYAKFTDTLQAAIDKYAAKPELAGKWCGQSKQLLLAVTDHATNATLKGSVEEELSRWDARIESLVTEICNA